MTGYDLHKVSILVIEPQSFMRKIFSDILKELGVKTIYMAATIKEGLGVFKDFSPDIILTDWSPGLNGIQLVKAIRQAPASPNPFVPIIVVTAHTDIRHVFTARDAGMTEFMVKPVRANLLYARIQSVIEKYRIFIRSTHFVGPDRRRRRLEFDGSERRIHTNMKDTERRLENITYPDTERRQGLKGYIAPEKREDMRL